MDWRALINSHVANAATRCVFAPPARPETLTTAEQTLHITLPLALRDLLEQTDGVDLQMRIRGDWQTYQALVWPVEEIISNTQRFRQEHRLAAPTDVLPFSELGNGDLFAFRTRQDDNSIVVWDHEDDSLTPAYSSLQDFIEQWSTGDAT
jgi:hypothetical protein